MFNANLEKSLDKSSKRSGYCAALQNVNTAEEIPLELRHILYLDEVGKLRYADTQDAVKTNSYMIIHDDDGTVEIVTTSYVKKNVIKYNPKFTLAGYRLLKNMSPVLAMRYDGIHNNECEFPKEIILNAEINFITVVPIQKETRTYVTLINKDGIVEMIKPNDYIVYNEKSKKVKAVSGKIFHDKYEKI